MSKIHRVQAEWRAPDGSRGRAVRWAGSMAEARELKREMVARNAGARPSDVAYLEDEVEFSKRGVLDFLNSVAEELRPLKD